MAYLGTLEVELLAAILEFVDDASPSNTAAVLQVNRHFFATAQLVAHRRKTLDLSRSTKTPNAPEQQLSGWLSDPLVLRGIRHLKVVAESNSKKLANVSWSQLAELIQKLSNLTSLTWSVREPFPPKVLDSMQNFHPRAKLSIYNFTRRRIDADENDPTEVALAQSESLVALHADFWNGTSSLRNEDLREPAFKRIVATAPNLKLASITKAPPRYSSTTGKEKSFYRHTRPNTALREISLDGYPMTKSTLEEWSKFVDLSQVETFKSTRGIPDKDYFDCAPGILRNLRSVSLNLAFCRDPAFAKALETYLLTCAPLSNISFWSWMDLIPLTTILRHGPTLTHLQLHERESLYVDSPRHLLEHHDVKQIRETCPKLEEFTMDLDREAEDFDDEVGNHRIYDELAKFGDQLKKIQLYFDLGLATLASFSENLPIDSDLDDSEDEAIPGMPTQRHQLPLLRDTRAQTFAERIWKVVFAHKRIGPRALDLKVGEIERKNRGSQWEQWEENKKQFWIVRPCVRDDQLGECIVRQWTKDGIH